MNIFVNDHTAHHAFNKCMVKNSANLFYYLYSTNRIPRNFGRGNQRISILNIPLVHDTISSLIIHQNNEFKMEILK
uniref:Uncharacterized protein n=1 Tax=Heterorhabditis bacteriophora TaxID=37862 RepID=A0A1I7WAZ4_HETBA